MIKCFLCEREGVRGFTIQIRARQALWSIECANREMCAWRRYRNRKRGQGQ